MYFVFFTLLDDCGPLFGVSGTHCGVILASWGLILESFWRLGGSLWHPFGKFGLCLAPRGAQKAPRGRQKTTQGTPRAPHGGFALAAYVADHELPLTCSISFFIPSSRPSPVFAEHACRCTKRPFSCWSSSASITSDALAALSRSCRRVVGRGRAREEARV